MPRRKKDADGKPILAASWWGQRWLETVAGEGGRARLDRGRELVEQSAVSGLVVRAGWAEADVRQSVTATYHATVRVAPIPDEVLDLAVRVLAGRASFTAALLSGRLPEEIDIVFAAAGGELLPAEEGTVSVSCTCKEEGSPCRHAAAVHVALGDRLDRDPFLLFLLRGTGRDDLLGRLRKARALRPAAPGLVRREMRELPTEPLPEVRPDAFFRPLEPLSTLRSRFVPPEHPDAILQRLGPPPLEDAEAARLLVDFHRAIGRGAAERLAEREWRRVPGRARSSDS